MAFIKVKSSQLHSLSYSPEDETLRIRFLCNGCKGADANCGKCGGAGHSSEYEYAGVPQEHYIALRDEKGSVGKKFGELIKRGPYKFKRVNA